MITAFTNGCFDLLTIAHIRLLKLAGEHATLVVGLNSDTSVRALKGPNRPIHNQDQREEVLRSIRWVDDVIIFDEPTVTRLILKLAPNVWVKGGDYTMETLNKEEVAAAASVHCQIVFAPKMRGISTTNILKKL